MIIANQQVENIPLLYIHSTPRENNITLREIILALSEKFV